MKGEFLKRYENKQKKSNEMLEVKKSDVNYKEYISQA